MTAFHLFACVLPLPRQEEAMKIAGIDVHKKVLMVVVVDDSVAEEKPARRRFVTLPSELQRFRIWLQEPGGRARARRSARLSSVLRLRACNGLPSTRFANSEIAPTSPLLTCRSSASAIKQQS